MGKWPGKIQIWKVKNQIWKVKKKMRNCNKLRRKKKGLKHRMCWVNYNYILVYTALGK